MVDYIKLTDQDLNDLIEISQMIVDWKHKTLTPQNWQQFELRYLPKLVEALDQNRFKVATSHNNILIWIIDQIEHSRVLIPCIKPRDCPPLATTKIGLHCLEFLRAASRGKISYDNFHHRDNFTNLFTE